ncbi:MAG: hypothetical protein ACPGTO_08190 [Polaribacter sp.]
MKSFILLIFCLLVFCTPEKTQAQDDWQIGIGAAIVRLTDSLYIKTLNEKSLLQIPRLNVTKKINEKFSINGAISFNSIEITEITKNKVNYFSIDSFLRYSVMRNMNFIDPYVFVGASLVSIDIKFTPAVNFGVGGTLWVLGNVGINAQAMYKLSERKISHFQYTGGLVFNLNSGRRTLWD